MSDPACCLGCSMPLGRAHREECLYGRSRAVNLMQTLIEPVAEHPETGERAKSHEYDLGVAPGVFGAIKQKLIDLGMASGNEAVTNQHAWLLSTAAAEACAPEPLQDGGERELTDRQEARRLRSVLREPPEDVLAAMYHHPLLAGRTPEVRALAKMLCVAFAERLFDYTALDQHPHQDVERLRAAHEANVRDSQSFIDRAAAPSPPVAKRIHERSVDALASSPKGDGQ